MDAHVKTEFLLPEAAAKQGQVQHMLKHISGLIVGLYHQGCGWT
jgi:hypothetical protein